jgi:hypothetical protein
MTKTKGTRNYNAIECERLLAVVATHLPCNQADWHAVADDYNAANGEHLHARNATSLQRKFKALYSSNRSAGSGRGRSQLKTAMKLHQQILRRCRDGVPSALGSSGLLHDVLEQTAGWPTQTAPESETQPAEATSQQNDGHAHGSPAQDDDLASRTSSCSEISPPTTTSNHPAHVDVLQLCQWFQRRVERHDAQLQDVQSMLRSAEASKQQRKAEEVRDRERRHSELLQCISSLGCSLETRQN